jgi:hypothetical protein
MIVEWPADPIYVSIAEKAMHLDALGMSDDKAIPRTIGVSDKTVAKAIAFAAD